MYVPRHLIETNLYTNGDEFILPSTGQEYIGFYWRNAQNQFFTGKNPNETPTIQLQPQPREGEDNELNDGPSSISSEWVTNYNNSLVNTTPGQLPTRFFPQPNEKDYEVGEFQRYFAKKSNQNIYLEIDKKQFDLLQNEDETILWQLYIPITIPWQLDNTIENAYLVNKASVERITHPGFTEWFRNDFTKFHHSNLDNN